MPTEINTKKELTEATDAGDSQLVVVDFYTERCGSCRYIAPKLEKFEKKYSDVKFYKVNVDKVSQVLKDPTIVAVPTLRLYKGKQQVGEVVGNEPGKLEKLIKEKK